MLAFFIMNALLLISLTAASIMIFETKMSSEIADSIPAFYAADAGVELCLYQIRTLGTACSTVETLNNGATFNASSSVSVIDSSGSYGGASRGIEVSW